MTNTENALLQQLYHRYSGEIYAYLFALCKNREVAEDLLQETFLKAILSLSDTHQNVRAWLYMVARNLFFHYHKKAAHCTTELPDESIPDTAPMPDNVVMDKLRSQMLYDALLQLDRIKREVILLQYVFGLAQKEIAGILQISPENVRVISYRAKKELKQKMEAQGYDIP